MNIFNSIHFKLIVYAILNCFSFLLSESLVSSLLKWKKVNTSISYLPDQRYSHNSININNSLYVLYGYYFNHVNREPVFLNDIWKLNLNVIDKNEKGSKYDGRWEELIQSYKPLERYGAITINYKNDIYFHGGDDGGKRYKIISYEHKPFSDLWRYCILENKWELLSSEICENKRLLKYKLKGVSFITSTCPPRLAQHVAVTVNNYLYLFGGLMVENKLLDSNFLYRLDLDEPQMLWHRYDFIEDRPSNRFAMSAIASNSKIYIFGGFSLKLSDSLNDLWIFDSTTYKWASIAQRENWPSKRGYAPMVVVNHLVYLFGGARCNPSCNCNAELWSMDIDKDYEWNLIVRGGPTHRYRHSMTHVGSSLYVFGGESFNPSGYYNDVHQFDLGIGNKIASIDIVNHYHSIRPEGEFNVIYISSITLLILLSVIIYFKKSNNKEKDK